MRITRCPRCRAEDIAADAHPARVRNNGAEVRSYVCRSCYRPAELEYRIACETAGAPYEPLPVGEALRGLREFYRARVAEWEDPDILMDEPERAIATRPIGAVLADIERRLAIAPVAPPRLDA